MVLPLALAAAGMQLAGGIMNGIEQSKALKNQANELGLQAKDAERVGAIKATQIAKEGRSVLGEAVTGMASSGIVTDTGSAQEIRDYIKNNAAYDAMNTAMSYNEAAYSSRLQAAEAKRKARSAMFGGILGGLGGAVGTIASAR